MDLSKLPGWEYKLPENAEPVYEEESTERPPLTGKTVRVPEGLYDQPWAEVDDAYGAATLTPYYIEALGSLDEGDREFGSYGLYAATTHQGSVYESSLMAVPFLVDMLEAEKEYGFVAASVYISRIAVGESHFIRTPKDVEESKSIYFYDVFKHLEQFLDFYNATDSEEMMRLLCFYPNALPDYLELKADTPEHLASKLVAQGFLAAERRLAAHIDEVAKLMYTSDSLLVRGAAAICLAFSGQADKDVMQLLEYLSVQDFAYTPWVWDALDRMCNKAWLYAADIRTLLQHKNNDEKGINMMCCITEALFRLFPLRRQPYLPNELSPLQKKLLSLIVGDYDKDNWKSVYQNTYFISSYELGPRALSTNARVLLRLLGKSEELLSTHVMLEEGEVKGYPVWYVLESYLLPDSNLTEEKVTRAISQTNIWQLLGEVFAPLHANKDGEKCMLSLFSHFNDNIEDLKVAKLISLFANALSNDSESLLAFLAVWNEKIKKIEDGYELAFNTPAQRIGTALLALARKGLLPVAYHPLVRTYHQYPEHSVLPLNIVAELLAFTSAEHQQAIAAALPLFNCWEDTDADCEDDEHEDEEDYEDEECSRDEDAEKIRVIKHSWTLLKGCKGGWVTDKLKDAAQKWNQLHEKYPGQFIGDPFPYNDAVCILKLQDKTDWELLNNLPRY